MKCLRALITRVATGVAIWLAVSAAWSVAARLGILRAIAVRDDGCIFHKPPSRWTKDDIDLLERRIRRLQAMPSPSASPSP